jgi:uncharacterized membrane protein
VRAAALALAGLAGSFAVTVAVHPWSDERISDLWVFRGDAAAFLGGALPYRDVFFEYPPLAAPVLALPGIGGTGIDDYRRGFVVMAFALATCVLLLVRELARRTGGDARLAMAAVALSPLLLGAALRNHFDLAPVALTLAALVLLVRARPVAGLSVLGLAVAMKGYPIAVAPVALGWLVARGDRRAALRGGALLAAIVVAAAAVPVAISPSGARDAFVWQAQRPVQVESTPATILNLAGVRPGGVESGRSDGLVHPAAQPVAAVVAALGAAALALLAVGAARRPDPRSLVLAALAATAAYAAFGKVLSPQYLVWTLPLMALALAWRMRVLAGALAAAMLLTFFEFPIRYPALLARDPVTVGVVAARDALLVTAVGLAVFSLPGARAAARWPSRGRRRPPRPAPR